MLRTIKRRNQIMKQLILTSAVFLAISCTSNIEHLPVSKALVLDLNADVGLTLEEENMVSIWTNQVSDLKQVLGSS